jgi:hypothetical protein
MKTFLNFIDTWGLRTTSVLVLLIFLKTCTTNSRINRLEDKITTTNQKLDTTKISLEKEIKIEGLKSEKRMIQSTDRKIMDVNRQSEIDKEISNLEK